MAQDHKWDKIPNKNQADASELGLKEANHMDGALQQARQGLNDWCKLHPPAFLKSYLRNELCFCLKLRCRFGQVDPEDYYAVFSNFVDVRGGHARESNARTAGVDLDLLPDLSDCRDDQKELVFIKVVVLLDYVMNSVIRSLAHVRLYRADDFLRGNANAVYQSARTGIIEFFTRGVDGKLVLPSWSAAIPGNERAKEVVQAGAQVMNDLASKNGEARRDGEIAKRYEHILSSIVAELSDHAIGFRISSKECRDFSIEILDIFFGPLNFCTTADEKIAHVVDPISITPEMIRAGADCLEEFSGPGALTNTATLVAERVYRAMERQLRGKSAA